MKIERITLKDAILMGSVMGDIGDAPPRYVKALVGVREIGSERQSGFDFLAFRLIGYIYQYRMTPTPPRIVKLQVANILSIEERGETNEIDFASLERRMAKSMTFARAYGWEPPSEHFHAAGDGLPRERPVASHRHDEQGRAYAEIPGRVKAHRHSPRSGKVEAPC